MSCYHPLKAFPIGLHDSGKTKYKITGYNTDFVTNEDNIRITDYTEIPCGKCIGCRLAYSRDWANRCMLEMQYHEEAHFITLTYNDNNLPSNEIINMETGEIKQSPVHTLVKEDFQKFMKRLRKRTGQDLRYFACGEYGSKTYRPHYHAIIFGLKLNDLKIKKSNFRGELYYTSPTIEKCWKHGYSLVCDVTWDTCAYVARYVTKKWKGKQANEIYDMFNITPQFSLMSRRPGIAKQYYNDNKNDIYKYDKIFMATNTGGKIFKPPKYYDKLYDIDYPSDMEAIKDNRAFVAEKAKNARLNKSDLTYEDYLYVAENNLLDRLGHIKERSTI